MKFAIVLAAFLAVVLARPKPKDVILLDSDFENIGLHSYNFEYEAPDGMKRIETAVVNNLGSENESISVQGSLTFTDIDGSTRTISYIADENGFQTT